MTEYDGPTKPEPKRRGRKPKIVIPPQDMSMPTEAKGSLKDVTVLWLPTLLTAEQRALLYSNKSPKQTNSF
jgi:hypothetical protein